MKIEGSSSLGFLIENFDFKKAWQAVDEDNTNKDVKQGFVLEGGSGSGKTFDVINFLIYFCSQFKNTGRDILIFRETYSDCKKTILKDFIRILRKCGLYSISNHSRSHPQSYKLYGNDIFFSGCDKIGAHGERHDIIYGNEGMELNFEAFKQLNQRCNIAFITDYNPSFTEHWIFDNLIPRPDTKFHHSTLLTCKYLPHGQRQEILSYEPTSENIKNGTADDYMWKVYGLGLRTANKGTIFKYVTWIDEFPEGIKPVYGLDFGFTNDPTCLVRLGLKNTDLYAKNLIYEPIDNAQALSYLMEMMRIDKQSLITADSSDKYNDEEMVADLINLGWNVQKVNKGKGINWRIGLLKKHRLCLVRDTNTAKEQRNYKWREINGIFINQPVDKFNHFWDALGYGYLGLINDNDFIVL